MPAQIHSDAHAVDVARVLSRTFAEGAADRDARRRLPEAEVQARSDSGLLAITAPAEFGGADVSVATLTEVFRLLSTADPSIAQIPHSHFVFLEAARRQGTPEQVERFFTAALAGERFANAQTERGGATVSIDSTALDPAPDGGYLLTGEKFYCTGSLFADWLVVRAVVDETPAGLQTKALAYVRRDTPGVEVIDDWDGMGQRTTGSGTVRLEKVLVAADAVVPFNALFAGPTTYGARAQVLHAAIDTGIARGALDAALAAVAKARPWFESGVAYAADEPLLIQQAGELELTVRGAEALLREAAAAIDVAELDPTEESTAQASIATALAKVAGARASIAASDGLFELGGTRSASASGNLSRFWRDARTHTLHDPARWKIQHVGRWLLSRTPPPRHGQL